MIKGIKQAFNAKWEGKESPAAYFDRRQVSFRLLRSVKIRIVDEYMSATLQGG